jgi:hypothetical protein
LESILEKYGWTQSRFYLLKYLNKWQVRTGDWNTSMGLRNVKYVHQLQNLYFALTGEELEIK